MYGMYILYAVDDHCCIVTVAAFHAYGTASESISENIAWQCLYVIIQHVINLR